MRRRGRHGTDYNVAPDAVTASSGKTARLVHWWFRSPATKTFSTIFIVVMVGGVLAMLVWPEPEAGTSVASRPAPTTPGAPATAAAAATAAPVCTPQKAQQVSPEKVILTNYTPQWVRVGDMSEPASPTGGPEIKKPFPICFARTPEGALYSATSFAAQAITASAEGTLREFFTARVSHTGNFDVLIADLPATNPPQDRPTVTITGYLWNSYTPDQASLQIRYRTVEGESLAKVYNLTWERNDWLLIAPGPGDQVNTDPTNKSFTPWGVQ